MENSILVTGGAGFIGSHLVDALAKRDSEILVIDNLSSGKLSNIRHHINKGRVKFIQEDLLRSVNLKKWVEKCKAIYHLAANPEVKVGSTRPSVHIRQNLMATYKLLEAARMSQSIENLVLTSTSTVYGETSIIPTPESYAPMKPISMYGASKLASEALVSAYAHNYGFSARIFRLANVVGSRSRHGVVSDFIKKLSRNPHKLAILGDGSQSKAYIYISDCIAGILTTNTLPKRAVEVFNLGSDDKIDVVTIAKIVVKRMGLKDVRFELNGGVDGGRGWIGDVKNMLLDCTKLKQLDWSPKFNSYQSIESATRELINERGLVR